ncbi:MAG: type ISP restriction/modification enzyme, partial [bacterium]
VETSPQLKRYLHTFPNLILTNFFEFRLYRNGRMINRVSIAKPFVMQKLKTVPVLENESEFFKLLEQFFGFSLPEVYDARTLAIELAKRTRFLRDEVITEELKNEQNVQKKFITGFYEAFKKYLIAGLSREEFADLYSQTITYGLFAARTRATNSFSRKLAYDYIPETIGILRDVFRFVSLGDPPPQMEWIIDDISEVLVVTDVYKILNEYYHQHKGKDPIVQFYETFLTEYDPETREKRGVYYTPEPVVSYIVRSIHYILKEHFNRTDGLADSNVTVLDPSAGTLTFLAEAAKLAVAEFVSRYGEGGKEKFIKEYILKNFYAFELMMAPYAVGHLKIAFLLEELGYKLKETDRFKLYLTNTLEMEELPETQFPGMSSLSEESHQAVIVKKKTPILVILGNPPYSGISANMKPEMVKFLKEDRNGIQSYYKVDGQPLGEKKLWLQNDYVKFIRFAQWKINRAGEGVLGFITDHSYLDSPTFRGMRQSLMNTFNEIYILDLHGNTLKRERAPDGSKDENVFDIQQGVAIALFVKKKRISGGTHVYHSEIWGLCEKKYKWLLKNHINTTKWKKLNPMSPYYFFIPRKEKGKRIYEKYWQITDIFPVNSVGIVTARDKFAIDFDKNILERRIEMFRNLSIPDEIVRQTFKLKDTSTFNLKKSREILAHDKNWDKYFKEILYRPFDKRYIYYTNVVIERPLFDTMCHMLQENLGVLVKRQNKRSPFSYVFVSNLIVESCVFESAYANNTICPLYLYHKREKPLKHSPNYITILFEPNDDYRVKKPNLSSKLTELLNNEYKKQLPPEQIFYYIYAVLYSNIYRSKYAEFLKIDFPRIPFTKDYKLFCKLAEYGNRLVALHLLKSEEIYTPAAKFQVKGNNKIEKVKYDEKTNRVYFNQNQYFEGVQNDIWEYQIGGYQVCEKWLKDRKGRELSLDDIKHYCKIVTALQKTIEIQKQIDKIYLEVEKATIELGVL